LCELSNYVSALDYLKQGLEIVKHILPLVCLELRFNPAADLRIYELLVCEHLLQVLNQRRKLFKEVGADT
jgi:hypothetical protein